MRRGSPIGATPAVGGMIVRLRQQADQLLIMGRNGRDQIESRFSRDCCGAAYENMLEKLCRGAGRTP